MLPMPTVSRRSGERGAAAVELALVLPVLLMLVFGTVEFGRGYNAKLTLTSAAREAARTFALGGDGAVTAMASVTDAFADDMVVTLVSACPAEPDLDDMVTVRAQYPFSYQIPFFRSGTRTLEAEASMRCGG